MSLFLMAAIGLASPVFAAAPGAQTTAFSDQQVATLLMQQQGKQAEIEAQLVEARRLVAAAKAAATRSPDPAKSVDLAPLEARVTDLEEQLGTVRSQITAIKAALAGKVDKAQYDALVDWIDENVARKADLDGLKAWIAVNVVRHDDFELLGDEVGRLADRVTALEDEPPVVAHDTVIRTTGFHPVAYVGVDLAVTKSYVPAYDTASGRVVAGVRPAWNVGSGAAELALDIEGNWTPVLDEGSGFGARAVPSIVGSFDGLDLGFGLGMNYDCSVLTAKGCLAEHIGAVARGTVLIGGNLGVRLHGDFEVNYLTVSAEQPELRTVIGASFYVGRRHDVVVPPADTEDSEDSE